VNTTGTMLCMVCVLTSVSAFAACPDPLPDRMSGAELRECISGFQTAIKQLSEKINVPSGAVVGFDRSDLDEDHCPDGWTPFLYARARTLVGAGDPQKAPEKMALDERGRPLDGYTLRQHGGEQIHQLTLDELPQYSPLLIKQGGVPFSLKEGAAVPCLDGDAGCNHLGVITEGRAGLSTTQLTLSGFGKAENSNNSTSPFIAVYYCKKN
jgi:hypothetical protein